MTSVLDLVQQSLAAAEPGRKYDAVTIIQPKLDEYALMWFVPENIRNVQAMVTRTLSTAGQRELEDMTSVGTRDGCYMMVVRNGYNNSDIFKRYFDGRQVDAGDKVTLEHTVYVDKKHIRDTMPHYEEMKSKPGAIEYVSALLRPAHLGRFDYFADALLKEGVPNVNSGLHTSGTYRELMFRMATVAGRPQITAKKAEALRQEAQRMQGDFATAITSFLDVCRKFSVLRFQTAYRLQEVE